MVNDNQIYSYDKNSCKMWGWLLLLISVEVTTWFFLKKYYITENNKNLFLGIFLSIYILIPFILIKLVKYEGIGILNMVWNICSTTLVIILGYYIFNEKINNIQYFGIGLGMLSIVLLSLNNHS